MDIKPIETVYNGYRFRGKEWPSPPKKKLSKKADLTGKKFGNALVIEFLGNEKHGYKWWGLICDCGVLFAARSRELKRGHTKSCGCLQKKVAKKNGGHNKLPYGYAARNELLASYKKSAASRKIKWNLTHEVFFNLVSSPCHYCGTAPNNYRKPNAGVNGGYFYSGIDRIDCSKGYEDGNVLPCCWTCNRAKNNMSYNEFLEWINRLSEYQVKAANQARFEHGEIGIA